MSFNQIINYKLLDTEKFDLTVSQLAMAIIILIITKFITIGLKKLIQQKSIAKRIDLGNSHAIYQMIQYIIWIAAILIAMDAAGIKITIFLAGSAALLVGIGLGLQEVFKDMLSGITLLFEGTLKVDDIVELNGIIGKVHEIGIRTTKIETRDNIIMIIPNSKFTSENVVNWSHMVKLTRFHVKIGVAYGSDVNKVTKILIDCCIGHKMIANSPSPSVSFSDFGDSSLDFKVFFWTDFSFEGEVIKSDIRYRIYDAFKENNITIPFPQRDVHIIKN